ncbi:hypothetical protein WA158_005555 [Blastocystis sp. Blastoise]
MLSHTIVSRAVLARNFAVCANAAVNVKALTIEKTKNPKPHLPKEKLVFGKTFTDHMLEMDHHDTKGWSTPKITPYHPIPCDPAMSVFHYGMECFEGMKAYLDADNHVRLFRPLENMKRMNTSMVRMALGPIDPEATVELIKKFVLLEKSWIPQGRGYSLYLRPTAIATDAGLGVHASHTSKFFVIASPVGPYYSTGFKPVKLVADEINRRSWPGGVGFCKCGGNYAPTVYVAEEWAKKGFSNILWLGPNKTITEGGAMNLFFFWKNEQGEKELITAPLNGMILPGITRKSIIELTKKWGEFKVTEREYTMDEIVKASNEKRLLECFMCGTAAVVGSVNCVHYQGVDYNIPLDPKDASKPAGPVTQRLFDTMTGIQLGLVENPYPEDPWSIRID